MMYLPSFKDQEPSDDWLLQESKRVKDLVEHIYEKTDLVKALSLAGRVSKMGGSYQYDVMIYPDIDIGVDMKQFEIDKIEAALYEFKKSVKHRKTSTTNTHDFKSLRQGSPVGYWLGSELEYEGQKIGLDCWFVGDEDRYEANLEIDSLMSSVSDVQKLAILRTKYNLIRDELYGKKYFSVDIYKAVMKRNILDYEQFLKDTETR